MREMEEKPEQSSFYLEIHIDFIKQFSNLPQIGFYGCSVIMLSFLSR